MNLKTIKTSYLQYFMSSAATEMANTKKNEASVKQAEVTVQSKAIAIEQADATEALQAAIPVLNAARDALQDLNKNDITEIRSFATPPSEVQVVCECIVIIKGIREISWKSCKTMMAETSFLKDLMNMQCEKITQAQVGRCKKHLKEANTTYDSMKSISKAGYGLLKFVNAVLNFCDVYKDVRPKQEKVEFLEQELATQIAMLEMLNNDIKNMENLLIELNEKYLDAMKEKELLTAKLDQAEARLVNDYMDFIEANTFVSNQFCSLNSGSS